MATTNFQLFDENKANMLTDQEYTASQQRLNGTQAGIASSMLNNKFAYQVSLVSYAITQMMNANGLDATDTMAVSAFVGNLSGSILQKVIDKATPQEAAEGTNNTHWVTPSLIRSYMSGQKATTAEAQAGTNDTKYMSPANTQSFYAARLATTAQVQAGTDNNSYMSPGRTTDFFNYNRATVEESRAGTNAIKFLTPLGASLFYTAKVASQATAIAGTDNNTTITPLKLNQVLTNTGSGVIIPVKRGGTGRPSYAANRILVAETTNSIGQTRFPAVAGSVYAQRTSGNPYWRSDIATMVNLLSILPVGTTSQPPADEVTLPFTVTAGRYQGTASSTASPRAGFSLVGDYVEWTINTSNLPSGGVIIGPLSLQTLAGTYYANGTNPVIRFSVYSGMFSSNIATNIEVDRAGLSSWVGNWVKTTNFYLQKGTTIKLRATCTAAAGGSTYWYTNLNYVNNERMAYFVKQGMT